MPCENAPMSPRSSPGSRPGAPGRDVPRGTSGGSPGATSGVVVEHEGPVTVVSIDRPGRRNAVDSGCAARLLQVFEAFEADEGSSVAVFTGTGGTFCAGADLKAVVDGDRRPIPDQGPGPMGPTRLTLSKPVVAAVEGFAVAGGLELALWCDLRVAAEDAVFGVFCRRFGVPLCDLGTVRLPRIIGARAGHGPDPDRPRRRRTRGAGHGIGQPARPPRPGAPGGRGPRPASWPRSLSSACAPTA